ncbi:MAG: 1-acyl-sn-glycerol-3-phosphate acyltransferase [Actinobacteria bacterium]|nr:1-acyl-sn-glycerol-3-phosphate acyltransferase [Actinomycetota bacterium]
MRRVLSLVARLACTLLLRRVEVADRSRIPTNRPILLVANHFNGFVDALVIASVLPRSPRFIAKGSLRKIPLLGALAEAGGVVFVRRQQDKFGPDNNHDAFSACHAALRKRDTIAIFPEGTTHDRPRIDPIKTGAARIALGARTAGATNIAILPVGLTFPDKVALRTSALVQLGAPIDLDDVCPGDVGVDDEKAVRALTAVIDAGVRSVSPDFADIETAFAMDQAAQITLSSEARPDPTLEERYDLTRRLGQVPARARAAVSRDVGRYNTLLSGLRLTDADVITPTNPTRLLRAAIRIAVLVVILGGITTATALVNVWPVALVMGASLLVRTPVSKGTVRAIVGIVAFPTAWVIAAVVTADGFLACSLVVLTTAVGAVAAVWLVERAVALTLMLVRWRAQLERSGTVDQAEAVRAEVVATTLKAVGDL